MKNDLPSLLAFLESLGATQKPHEANCYWVKENKRDALLNFVADMRAELYQDDLLFVDFQNQSIKIQFYASAKRISQAPPRQTLLYRAWQYLTT